MPLLFGGFGLVLLVLWVFCIFDVITTPPEEVRGIPKLFWLLVVLVLPDVGSVLWLIAGRPKRARRPREPIVPPNPDDDEEFMRQLRQRVEEQRRRTRDPRQDD